MKLENYLPGHLRHIYLAYTSKQLTHETREVALNSILAVGVYFFNTKYAKNWGLTQGQAAIASLSVLPEPTWYAVIWGVALYGTKGFFAAVKTRDFVGSGKFAVLVLGTLFTDSRKWASWRQMVYNKLTFSSN